MSWDARASIVVLKRKWKRKRARKGKVESGSWEEQDVVRG